VSRLVQITKPVLRIPTLAIHLDRSVDEGFKFNKEEQLLPILASTLKSPENTKDGGWISNSQLCQLCVLTNNLYSVDHHRILLELIAEDLKVKGIELDHQNFVHMITSHHSRSGGHCLS